MKKILCLILICLLVSGCGKVSQKDIIKDLSKKIDKCSGYKLEGSLKVNNNDETYNYDITVGYKKDDYYKVTITNTSNDHTQVILKNDDGVYLVTPSLNKSFKFQSEWPYDNSQIYLLDAIIRDIEEDDDRTFTIKDNNYIFNTKVDYPNNNKLSTQKVIFDKNLNLKSVSVYDSDGIVCMKLTVKKQNYSSKFKDNYFDLDSIIDSSDSVTEDDNSTDNSNSDNLDEDNVDDENTASTSNLDDVIYPLFLPSGTKLVSEEKVTKSNGERIIMNYDGEKSFLLVEETADVFNELTIIPTSGEPFQLLDTMGVMTDNSLSWVSNGIEYYLVSDVMDSEELVEVAQSIGGIVSTK
jgi:outer membrane lipoprotein-sorting protein